MRLVNDDRVVSARKLFDLIEDGTELLQGGNNDISTVLQSLRKTLGAVFDVLGNALLTVNVHKLRAKLTVNNSTVADHDNRVDVLEINESLCQPSNGFGFSATCAMPDEVTMTYTIFFYITFALQNRAQLMKTREDHLTLVINKHEFANDTEKHILLENLLPDVVSTMFSGGYGITCSLILGAHVVWQKTGVLLVKLRSDKSHHLVHGKVGKRALVE